MLYISSFASCHEEEVLKSLDFDANTPVLPAVTAASAFLGELMVLPIYDAARKSIKRCATCRPGEAKTLKCLGAWRNAQIKCRNALGSLT